MLAKIKAFFKGLQSLLAIPAMVVAIDIACFLAGGLMTGAVVAGVGLVISFVCILLNFNEKAREKFNRCIGGKVGIIDLFQTLALTVLGFSLGVNMGFTLIVVSLNISAFLCMVRIGRIIVDLPTRTEFHREIGLRTCAA